MPYRVRCFTVTQYLQNPRTKEDLHFNMTTVDKAARKYSSIKKWAYILHDKDRYTKEDEEKCDKTLEKEYKTVIRSGLIPSAQLPTLEEYIEKERWVHVGELKPSHIHFVGKFDDPRSISDIARWFGVPEQQVEAPKGKGAFYDCVRYLTHEDSDQISAGKHRYDDSEVIASFDFRKELNERESSNESSSEESSSSILKLRLLIFRGEMTLHELRGNYPEKYVQDSEKLKKCRTDYLQTADPPNNRINIYIDGGGGVGKGVASKLLAHCLFPEITDDSELYYVVGADGVNFEAYDGQPVIIWNDCRSGELFRKLGGRGNIFNVFDPHPTKQLQNIKYGSVNLINSINIVNSVQPYKEFLDGLVGEFQDRFGHIAYKAETDEKYQSYRRFPIILSLRPFDFDVRVNRGFMECTGCYGDYDEYLNIVGNFGDIVQSFPLNSPAATELAFKMLKPVLDTVARIKEREANRESSCKTISSKFAYYGEIGSSPDDRNSRSDADIEMKEDGDDPDLLF